MELYTRYLFFLICSLAVLWITGTALVKTCRLQFDNFFTGLFARFFSGICIVVILSSVYYTSGKTVNTGLLIGGAFLAYFYFRNKISGTANYPVQEHIPKWYFIISGVVLLIIFTSRFYLIYNHGNVPFLPNADTLFHANVSNFLGVSGLESISLDYFNILPKTNEPYHYFDLWFNTTVFKMAGLNSLTSYILITVTIFLFICWVGFMAIASCFTRINFMVSLISFSFLFFSGIYLPFYARIHILEQSNVFCADLFYYTKLAVVFIFLQASLICYIKSKTLESVIIILLIPVVFISTSVAIYATVFLWIAWKSITEKNLKFALQSGVIMLTLVVFFVFFYKTNQPAQTIKIRAVEGGFFSLFTLSYLKTCINIIGLSCIQLFFIFLPILLVLSPGVSILKPYLNPVRNGLAFFIFVIFIISLGAWATLHYMVDTVQLFSNISIAIITILFFVMVMFLNDKISRAAKTMMYCMLLAIFGFKICQTIINARPAYAQSDKYLIETSEAIQKINPIGVFILNDSSYSSLFSKNPIFSIAGKHLAYASSRAYTYSLSVFNTPISKTTAETDRQLMERSVFFWFVKKQKAAGEFKSIPISQFEFIRRFSIDYLVADRGVVIDTVVASLITSAIVDSNTGERFYLLGKNKSGVAHNPETP